MDIKRQTIKVIVQPNDKSAVWFVETVEHPRIVNGAELGVEKNKPKIKRLNFIQKFVEIQDALFRYNAALSDNHPYASYPLTWPVLTRYSLFLMCRGVSFWETKKEKKQIYLLGNPILWWSASFFLLVYVAVWIVDRILLHRGIDDIGHVKID